MANKRESNIELLRIIAMFMILGLHVNMLALGLPEKVEITENPTTSIIRFFFEHLCIIGVNIFVLISGWFGIRYKNKGICNFLFQALFFSLIIFIPSIFYDNIEPTRINVLSAFLLYKNAYWFVWAYLILYIISPVLNAFADNVEKHIYKRVLSLLFIVQTIVFLFTSSGFYHNGGYDPLAFISLYLLMRYIKKYPVNIKRCHLLLLWFLCVSTNTLLCCTGNSTLTTISLAYVNPLNIIGAVAIVLLFTKLSIKSNFINNIASSCFAVYLFHMHFCIIDYYKAYALTIFNKNGGVIYLIHIFLFMCIVFAIAILMDKVRIFTFNKFWNIFEKRKNVTQ